MVPILLCCAMNSTIFSGWNYLEKSYFKLLLSSTLLSKPKEVNQTKGRNNTVRNRSQVYSNLVQKEKRRYGPRSAQHRKQSSISHSFLVSLSNIAFTVWSKWFQYSEYQKYWYLYKSTKGASKYKKIWGGHFGLPFQQWRTDYLHPTQEVQTLPHFLLPSQDTSSRVLWFKLSSQSSDPVPQIVNHHSSHFRRVCILRRARLCLLLLAAIQDRLTLKIFSMNLFCIRKRIMSFSN